MNRYQRLILVLTALLVFVTLLFPPFTFEERGTGRLFNRGFDFIGASHNYMDGGVDYSALRLEWLGIILIGMLIYFSLHKLNK